MRELILNDYFLLGVIAGAWSCGIVSTVVYVWTNRVKSYCEYKLRRDDDYKRKSDSFWDQVATSRPPKPTQKHVLLPSGIKCSKCNGSGKDVVDQEIKKKKINDNLRKASKMMHDAKMTKEEMMQNIDKMMENDRTERK